MTRFKPFSSPKRASKSMKMPLEIHSLVQDADNQDVALRAKYIEDYVMSAMKSVHIGHNLFILF